MEYNTRNEHRRNHENFERISHRARQRRRRKRRFVKAYIFVCVIMFGILCARGLLCGGVYDGLDHPEVSDDRSADQIQMEFDAFVQQVFVKNVTEDSLTLHYTLQTPEKYGIDPIEPTLGEYSLAEYQEAVMESENWLASLEGFRYEALKKDQQLIYDVLRSVLQTDLKFSDLLEYQECLGPTTGIQAQLPVLLAEYSIETCEDVNTYITLLNLIPDYFSGIETFEREKSEKGLFMSDTTVEAVIKQCQEFITNPEDNYLITIFEDKLDEAEDLSESQKKEYIEENRTAVLESVIPAYEGLIDTLTELKGTGNNEGGLCKLPEGKEYYEYLVEAMTGSHRAIDDLDTMADVALHKAQKAMAKIMSDSPDAYYDAQDITYPCTDPAETLEYLRQQIAGDFESLPEEITCDIKYVDESLEDSLSPAFYLTSPLDNYKENVVYLNLSDEYDLSEAFSTLGHEGYPGHLYQNAYFASTEPEPIRSIISVGGYSEGWGTYAEIYSYELAGFDKNTTKLLQENTVATLCLYAKADIGVNYHGWSLKKLCDYLDKFGFESSQGKIVYDAVTAEPVSYLQYTLGYLEIEEMIARAQESLGDKFTLKEFHRFFLSLGSVPFDVAYDRLEDWIELKSKS